jgi:hypothetical protein
MRSKKFKIQLCLGIAVSIAALFVIVPLLIRARMTPAENACLNNLRHIDGAKQTWQIEHHKSTNDVPTVADIQPYLGRGPQGEFPPCPRGGKYIIGKVSEPARCYLDGPAESFR